MKRTDLEALYEAAQATAQAANNILEVAREALDAAGCPYCGPKHPLTRYHDNSGCERCSYVRWD